MENNEEIYCHAVSTSMYVSGYFYKIGEGAAYDF